MSEKKNYLVWHVLKAKINQKLPLGNYHEREIWWCSLGANIGFEEDGKNQLFERPVLILKKFNQEIFVGVPLTTTRKNNKYYYLLEAGGLEGSIILSQLRTLSSRRLQRKLGRIGKKKFADIKVKVEMLLVA